MEIKQQSESQERDQQQSTPQNQSEFQLVPFVQMNTDEWILSDDFLDGLFDKIVEQDLLKIMFWEEHVTDHSHFIRMMKNPNNQVVVFFRAQECVGLAWMTGLSGNYGFGHFCLFREVWGNGSTEIGKNTLDYWFSWPGTGGPLLDVIIGIMPGFNRRAHKFIERIGMTRLGIIPGMFRDVNRNRDDAVIYYKARE